jgi:peptidoglycan/xylan/chitin deacetylase (PgdA/CDA1 family)
MEYKVSKMRNFKNLDKTRFYWSFITLILFGGMISSSFLLKENIHLIDNLIGKNVAYLRYSIEYSVNSGNGITGFFAKSSSENPIGVADGIPVLLYHGVVEEADGSNILLEDFKEQMFALKEAGYQTITLEDFKKFMDGEKKLPEKSFLLTFDDGRKDSYYPVDPILKVLDYNAVIFVITDHIGDSGFYLSKNELSKMIESGRWEINSHGKDSHTFSIIDFWGNEGHSLSNRIWIENKKRWETDQEFRDRITNDFVSSKKDLADLFSIEAIGFAFPYGDYGQYSINYKNAEDVIKEEVKKVYKLCFYQYNLQKGNFLNYPDADEFMIKRIKVKPKWSGEELISFLVEEN